MLLLVLDMAHEKKHAQTNLYQKFKDTKLVIRSRKGQTTQWPKEKGQKDKQWYT